MPTPIKPEDLVFHFLNVGFGDAIVVEFPVDAQGNRSYGLVDCYNATKTRRYLDGLRAVRSGDSHFEFICATHPHEDHIKGINALLTDATYRPKAFWESGFRHKSGTYIAILQSLLLESIPVIRVSSGMEWYFGRVQVTALAPSIRLRNRYATYGVDMNNSSIVLRFEHRREDVGLIHAREYTGGSSLEAEREAGAAVIILAGDAEYDSWAHITDEFPRLERVKAAHEPLVKRMVNYLACALVKVAHHGSMHSTPLDVYEKMWPEKAVISTKQEISSREAGGVPLTRGLYPHSLTVTALEECGVQIWTTDGSYEAEKEAAPPQPGSIVVVLPPGGPPRWQKLTDPVQQIPAILTEV